MEKNLLTENFSEPLNGTQSAQVDIHAGDGNLIVDRLADGATELASGMLQYFEDQDRPTRFLAATTGKGSLTLKGGSLKRPWLHFPWSACNGATKWQIHLNPAVALGLTAASNGGNIRLDLAGMTITRVAAETGGGNVEVTLPESAADIHVIARTGAGNVVVRIPSGAAARIHASTGLGKAIIDPQLSRIDKNTYQSPGFDQAAHKIEIMASSGAGNVSIQVGESS